MFGSTESIKKIVETPTPIYTVKNVKDFIGREGHGYECSLYKDGKRIGRVTDTAGGGMVDFYLDKGEKEILDTHCKTLPKWGKEYGDSEYDTDCDHFVTSLVSAFEANAHKMKQYRKWCKNQTVFRVVGDKDGEFRTLSQPYTESIKAHLEKKFVGQGLVIVNELIKK